LNGEIQFPFVNLMNEISRILKPGGIFYAVTPMYPSGAAFTDPTHVNFISEDTVHYFAGANRHAANLGYGFVGHFDILFAGWLRGAGPFDSKGSLQDSLLHAESAKERLIVVLKLLRRSAYCFANRKPTHALWVLQKPMRLRDEN